MTTVWAGIDAGKRAHHCVVIDRAGTVLYSQRVDNDETALLELIAGVLGLAEGDTVCWATDLNAGGAVLMIALLAGHGQQLLYPREESFTMLRRPTAVMARLMPKTPESSLTRPGCAPTCNRFVAPIRSASTCVFSPPGAPT